MSLRCVVSVAALLSVTEPAAAQRLAAARVAFVPAPAATPSEPPANALGPASDARVAAGAAAGAAIAAGFLWVVLDQCYDFDCAAGALLTLAVEPGLVAWGGHLANGRRGLLRDGVMGSYMALVMGGLLGLVLEDAAGPRSWPYTAAGVLLVQNLLVVNTERRTTLARQGSR